MKHKADKENDALYAETSILELEEVERGLFWTSMLIASRSLTSQI